MERFNDLVGSNFGLRQGACAALMVGVAMTTCMPGSAHAAYSYVAWSVSGSLGSPGAPGTPVHSETINKSGGDIVSFDDEYVTSDHSSSVLNTAGALSDLTASVHGPVFRFSFSDFASSDDRGQANVRTSITMGFNDSMTVKRPGVRKGTQVTVNALMFYTGSYFADSDGEAPHTSNPNDPYSEVGSQLFMVFDGNGAPAKTAVGRGFTPAYNAYTDSFNLKLPGSISEGNFTPLLELSFPAKVGEEINLFQELTVTGSASSQSYAGITKDSTASTFADFSHTVLWGGISSITVDETGETLDGWEVESESGFNYANAAPEPSALALMAFAGCALGRRRRAM